jgi:2-polyprenyl-3-methyl-5-hydroxy-6-metoxy-1,4-benzoquinol methylase
MDFLNVYSSAFANKDYSGKHHIQYDYVLQKVLELNLLNNKIVDIGSGRGKIIKMLNENKALLKNNEITSVDLKQFHSEPVDAFIPCNLSNPEDRNLLLEKKYDILICTDVFEHLQKSFIEDVICMCSRLADICILSIANHSDVWNGIELHTIRENDKWWENALLKYFVIEDKQTVYGGRLYNYTLRRNPSN